MPLVTSKDMLVKAKAGGYAVGAFNGENLEMIQAIIAAAEEVQAPVIVQTTSSTIRYASPAIYAGIVKGIAEKASVPVALHLDHGNSYELAVECVNHGYSSIMIDGSHGTFEENVAITNQVIHYCRERGIPVEAELGKVGGKEDDVIAENDMNTDVDEAVEFYRQTQVDFLAIAIGTAHGFYHGTPHLNKERINEIAARLPIPLVLHGTSGIADEEVADCVRRGMCKVNYATELRDTYTKAVKEVLASDEHVFDPKVYGKAAREAVKQVVMSHMKNIGSDGKA